MFDPSRISEASSGGSCLHGHHSPSDASKPIRFSHYLSLGVGASFYYLLIMFKSFIGILLGGFLVFAWGSVS